MAVSFILMAYNVFSSGWFTALNDGKTSAILSFCRTILFMVVPVLVLPRLFGVDGVWLSLSVAEPADDHLLLREISQGLDARTRDGRTDGAAIRKKGAVSAVPFLRFGLRPLPRQVLRL